MTARLADDPDPPRPLAVVNDRISARRHSMSSPDAATRAAATSRFDPGADTVSVTPATKTTTAGTAGSSTVRVLATSSAPTPAASHVNACGTTSRSGESGAGRVTASSRAQPLSRPSPTAGSTPGTVGEPCQNSVTATTPSHSAAQASSDNGNGSDKDNGTRRRRGVPASSATATTGTTAASATGPVSGPQPNAR